MQRTIVILKPDSLQRSLVGKIIERFENKGFIIQGCKMAQLNEKVLREHYAHIADKPFFPDTLRFMQSTPVVILCLAAEADTTEQVRKVLGATNCRKAENGTIRSDFGNSIGYNLVHASDSPETAEIEIKRFFSPDELFEWKPTLYSYIYEN